MQKIFFTGKFIVLDGPDGCGKSTQAALLREKLISTGLEVVSYRDPGTTRIGEAIREILLATEYAGMGDNVEVLLYMAARAQLWREKISSDLENGKCVIMDRWLSSTCAYQGKAGGFGIDKVINIARDSLERLWPDITIILDIDSSLAAKRIRRELDRMELKGCGYHKMVRQGYLELADKMENETGDVSALFKLINADDTPESIHSKIVEILINNLGKGI
ncbi:Thymidylate kinase [Limihaloglobus sulfuriphilus]|uniref:Thymidylate kinase n=1 Tax=Limihaloglobus sulfuriphilus TaxID=1851148 RepID=A0A1Q2MBT1_9BACT|nr:dTMP kinase [Limihaloglobus sulfuriphilus]AQQ69988.1 Thymidylate kinase [Limihaloglobus sulfuriphilus]